MEEDGGLWALQGFDALSRVSKRRKEQVNTYKVGVFPSTFVHALSAVSSCSSRKSYPFVVGRVKTRIHFEEPNT